MCLCVCVCARAQGDYGPFRPGEPAKVPLWLAVQLRKNNLCRVQVPFWMKVDWLAAHYKKEQDEAGYFEDMPYHYLEISALLLAHAAEDVPDTERVRALIEDISNLRATKIRNGLKQLRTGLSSASLTHISAMELNNIRPLMSKALDRFKALGTEEVLPDEDEDDAGLSQGAAAAAPAAGAASGDEDDLLDDDADGSKPRKLRRFRE